jgi:hypothetical protein
MTSGQDPLSWHLAEGGSTIGQLGSEEGVILQDEEHDGGARITLERRDGKPARFAITCGVYGWFVHTRFFAVEEEARNDLIRMKTELARILDLISRIDSAKQETESVVLGAIELFVDRFPT